MKEQIIITIGSMALGIIALYIVIQLSGCNVVII